MHPQERVRPKTHRFNRLQSIAFCNRIRIGTPAVSEYVFKLKKGDLELELKSDDAKFIETQMDNWRNMLVTQEDK